MCQAKLLEDQLTSILPNLIKFYHRKVTSTTWGNVPVTPGCCDSDLVFHLFGSFKFMARKQRHLSIEQKILRLTIRWQVYILQPIQHVFFHSRKHMPYSYKYQTFFLFLFKMKRPTELRKHPFSHVTNTGICTNISVSFTCTTTYIVFILC